MGTGNLIHRLLSSETQMEILKFVWNTEISVFVDMVGLLARCMNVLHMREWGLSSALQR